MTLDSTDWRRMEAKSLACLDTEYSADSVEWCPDPRYEDLFVCGTYQVVAPAPVEPNGSSEDDDENEVVTPAVKIKRLGRCLVYFWDASDNSIEEVQRIDGPAILDMKWAPFDNIATSPLLAIADAEGRITLYRWAGQERSLHLAQIIQLAPIDVLCLSLDWSNRRNPSSPGSLIVSRSDGFLSLLSPTSFPQFELEETMSWKAHEYEPWIVAWDYWNTSIVYSGGDDCTLKGWDVQTSCTQPIFTNRRFDAGITTIQTHPHIPHLLAVGSYDSSVRLFSTEPSPSPTPTLLSTIDVGGGVWRVKWHPSLTRGRDLLVACMHDGFKILRYQFPGGGYEGRVAMRFDAHERGGLAYGVDWAYGVDDEAEEGQEGRSVIASCSFYDHALHIWKG